MTRVYFDESLGRFVSALAAEITLEAVQAGTFLRDATGRLAFISAKPVEEQAAESLTGRLHQQLPVYTHPTRIVLDATTPGVAPILAENAPCLYETIQIDDGQVTIKTLDHRIVGSDWLTRPVPGWAHPDPARFVFASLKGGVGRSTALAVAAAHFAKRDLKVLVLDLDLEAPGVGYLLLTSEEMPRFGILDYLVEDALAPLPEEFLVEMQAPSPFGAKRGLIDVVPVCGRTSKDHPANVLAKLARAYLESPEDDGGPAQGLLQRTQTLLKRLSALKSYDVVLIDARAGLSESTAAAILGLGAEVLLFGVDTPQTFETSRFLAAHLAQLVWEGSDDWLPRLKWIQAKASTREEAQKAFRDRIYDVCEDTLYAALRSRNGEESSLEAVDYSLEAQEAPHHAWPVLFDQNYLEFDPLNREGQLDENVYQAVFSTLLKGIEERMEVSG